MLAWTYNRKFSRLLAIPATLCAAGMLLGTSGGAGDNQPATEYVVIQNRVINNGHSMSSRGTLQISAEGNTRTLGCTGPEAPQVTTSPIENGLSVFTSGAFCGFRLPRHFTITGPRLRAEEDFSASYNIRGNGLQRTLTIAAERAFTPSAGVDLAIAGVAFSRGFERHARFETLIHHDTISSLTVVAMACGSEVFTESFILPESSVPLYSGTSLSGDDILVALVGAVSLSNTSNCASH